MSRGKFNQATSHKPPAYAEASTFAAASADRSAGRQILRTIKIAIVHDPAQTSSLPRSTSSRRDVGNAGQVTLKVALVHDYLKEVGGAERVLMVLKEMFPNATVYTAYKFPPYWGQFRDELLKWDIRESWGRWLPFLPKFISYYTILSPLFFSRMDLSEYDLVIVSATGGYFPNGVKIGEKTGLLTYCHTPPRFLYGYPTATVERNKWYWKPISAVANLILRQVDFRFAQRPHLFIANSKNVARRIWKFYRRESVVVYPPIQIPNQLIKKNPKLDYYLMVSRIVGGKNIEMVAEAAEKGGFKLMIAGRPIGRSGREILNKISNSKSKMVKYLGEVSDEERGRLFAGARAFLAMESDADFGITAVEPQIYGTPVIAYRGGGYLETVVEGKTGIFVDRLDVDGVIEAVEKFEKTEFNSMVIRNNAEKFSKETFKEQMIELIAKYAGIT